MQRDSGVTATDDRELRRRWRSGEYHCREPRPLPAGADRAQVL